MRLNLTAGAALAHHAHKEVAEAIFKTLYVGQDAHGGQFTRAPLDPDE